ncbi:uncharacterized protein LOC110686344 [Chenopodium quinoa]|uniref:uncharacterized protein LOC110686344 n=1 Tax=Chenopodium quinoa TaxID=63459 RepID=UPI000B775DC2|nr:uncharacterized protein LOC110686344 [Chenopodium quinoa]
MKEDVDAINEFLIEKFPREYVVYKSYDSILDDNCILYPTEFLNTLCSGGMSPHELVLKENSPVILLRNIDPFVGLYNGTRLTCKRFFRNVIQCVIAIGHYQGVHMKPQYVSVNKLTPKIKGYKIKVTLKEKSSAKAPPGEKTFQKLVFEDHEGNEIMGTLFQDEVEHFKHLSFGGQTAITQVDPTAGPVLPLYTPIAQVPPTSNKDDQRPRSCGAHGVEFCGVRHRE